eukprot:2591820-Ditylum_brightwellii.AAC.1
MTIKDVVHMPGSSCNLFSLTKRLNQRWTLGGNSDSIWLKKGGQKIVFDIKIKTPKGAIYAIYTKRHPSGTSEVATVGRDPSKPVDVQTTHGTMGHINKVDSRKSIKHLGYEIKQDMMSTCGACAEAKTKQKNLPSRVETSTKVLQVKEEVKTINKRMHLDISTIKAPVGICMTVTKLQW